MTYFQVLFIKVVGNVTFSQVTMFLSIIGLCNLAINWTILLTLLLTDTEIVEWSYVPWDCIVASAAFTLGLRTILHICLSCNIMTDNFYYSVPFFIKLGNGHSQSIFYFNRCFIKCPHKCWYTFTYYIQ